MNYTSTTRIQSAIAPEIFYTLRKMSWGRRNQFNEMMVKPFGRMAEARREREFLEDQPPFKKIIELRTSLENLVPPAEGAQDEERKAFVAKVDAITDEIDALAKTAPPGPARQIRDLIEEENNIDRAQAKALLDWALIKIEGLEIDGNPTPSVEMLVMEGPEKVVEEICKEISKRMRLGDTEIKNLESPTTSAGVAGGSGPNTTATSASETSTT